MSRYLILAFLLALFIHSLLALIRLDIITLSTPAPRHTKYTALDINLVKPVPPKKPVLIKHTPPVVKATKEKPPQKKEVKKKVKPRVKVKKKDVEKVIAPPVHVKKEEKKSKKETPHVRLAPIDPPPIKPPLKSVDIPVAPLGEEFLPIPYSATEYTGDEVEEVPKINEKVSEPPVQIQFIPASPIKEKNPVPLYPALARRRGYQGKTLLEVLVTKDGNAGYVRVIKSSGYQMLDKAAVSAVKKWLFYPAKRGDEPVETWVKIPVRFQLK